MREILLKEIENHSGHFASFDGRLFVETGRYFKHTNGVIHRDGMRRVLMERDNPTAKEIEMGVSAIVVNLAYLVAETFLQNPNNYQYITFKDKHRDNPAADNLDWISDEEWENEQIYWKGELMYGITGFDGYYISESKIVYSNKGTDIKEHTMLNDAGNRFVMMSNDEKKHSIYTEELWERRYPATSIEGLTTARNDDYDVLMTDERDLMVQHVESGQTFETMQDAAYQMNEHLSTIENNVYRIVDKRKFQFVKKGE